MTQKYRILLAKGGLDGHDRGIRVIAMALRDANFEVIYTGRRQMPKHIVEAAVQEDVDAIGISTLSGAHMTLLPKVLNLLQDKGATDILVFVGGIIPPEDAEALKKIGIKEIFGPGTPIKTIVASIKGALEQRERS